MADMDGYFIPKSSQYPRESWLWIRYLADQEAASGVRRLPTAWRKRSRNCCTSACGENSGLRPRRAARQCRADRGEIPRHPSGAGVSRVPGSHREGADVRAAQGRAHRHAADRVLRYVPLRRPSAAFIFRTPNRRTSRSAKWGATRSRTTRAAKACRSRRRSAGLRRISPTKVSCR